MFNIGIDMIEIQRVKNVIYKNKNFLNFILGLEEFEELKKKDFPIESIAANFCAKEAFLKVIGFGIFSLDLKNIQILRDISGAPKFYFTSDVHKICKDLNLRFSLSITHTKKMACSVVIASKES